MFLYIPDMDFVLKKESKKHKIYILSFYRLFLSLYSALEPTNAQKH